MVVGMDWATIALVLLAVTAYAAVVVYLRRRIAAEEAAAGPTKADPRVKRTHQSRHGAGSPNMSPSTARSSPCGPCGSASSTSSAGISWPLRAYASVGVVAVAVISALFAFSLFFSLRYTLQVRPPPTGIYAPQNLLLIPGLNEFVPGTVAVWLALVITLVVHEFGHGILSRVEGIRVKAAGLLVAVVPIGAFVEPDEEELEKAPRWSKMRMYGAGISNNIVVGLLSFFLMIAVFGLAVPIAQPVVSGVYKDFPAYNASVTPGSFVLALNGTPVADREDVARLLAPTAPGDRTSLTVETDGMRTTHELTLAKWPTGNATSGFMGIEDYNGQAIQEYVAGSFNPIGILRYLILPFDTSSAGQALRIVGFPGSNTDYWVAPFWGFWGMVQLLFWSGWINLNVGNLQRAPDGPVRRRVHLPRGRRRPAGPAPAPEVHPGGGQRRLLADGRDARLADRAAVPVQPLLRRPHPLPLVRSPVPVRRRRDRRSRSRAVISPDEHCFFVPDRSRCTRTALPRRSPARGIHWAGRAGSARAGDAMARWRRDRGLHLRMVVTVLLLAIVYTKFIAILAYQGIGDAPGAGHVAALLRRRGVQRTAWPSAMGAREYGEGEEP